MKYYQGSGGGGDQYNDVSLLQFTSRVITPKRTTPRAWTTTSARTTQPVA